MMLSLRRCSTSATNRRAGCMRSRASTPFVSRQSAALPPVNYKKQSVQKMYFTTKVRISEIVWVSDYLSFVCCHFQFWQDITAHPTNMGTIIFLSVFVAALHTLFVTELRAGFGFVFLTYISLCYTDYTYCIYKSVYYKHLARVTWCCRRRKTTSGKC